MLITGDRQEDVRAPADTARLLPCCLLSGRPLHTRVSSALFLPAHCGLQVDAAAAMVERLLQPLDEEMNEHKKIQVRGGAVGSWIDWFVGGEGIEGRLL